MKTSHKIIHGDSRKMSLLPDKSVHLIVTSPPYWQLKDYGTEEQIGFNESYESYINNLNLVWNECYRVLHNGCRMCINIGDQFARSVYYGRYKVIPIRTEIIKFCEQIGFDYMGAVIWQKKTTTNTTGGASLMGSFPTPRNGVISIDYEFILIFKKLGTPPKVSKEIKELSKLTTDEWKTYFSGHWNFGGVKQDSHIAMFPEELPNRLIKMFAFKGETVLDPFMGSGTTLIAAQKNGRNSIGYEINQEFIEIAREKVQKAQRISSDEQIQFLKDENRIDLETALIKMPYLFKDTHRFNNKTDIKKHQYGSKIDQNSKQPETYYSVKEIISSELVKLSNNQIIKLIGIKENPDTTEEAIAFMEQKTKGKKVFLKNDSKLQTGKDYQLSYLYLKNKTFINAHLIKNGLAEADSKNDYKYKEKFIKLSRQKT